MTTKSLKDSLNIPHHITMKAETCSELPTLREYIHERLNSDFSKLFDDLLVLRFSTTEKYPVDFDNLWEELEYTRKDSAKDILIQNYSENIEYVFFRSLPEKSGRGRPVENIYLTLEAAQKFALQSRTKKGKTIADFFIQSMKCMQDYTILSLLVSEKLAKLSAREDALLSQVKKGTGDKVQYTGDLGNGLLKYGSTDNLYDRVLLHKKHFGQFHLIHIVKTIHYLELEKDIEVKFEKNLVRHKVKDVNHREIIKLPVTMGLKEYLKVVDTLHRSLIEKANVENRIKEKEIDLLIAKEHTISQLETNKVQLETNIATLESQEKLLQMKHDHEVEIEKIRAETERFKMESQLKMDENKANRKNKLKKEKEMENVIIETVDYTKFNGLNKNIVQDFFDEKTKVHIPLDGILLVKLYPVFQEWIKGKFTNADPAKYKKSDLIKILKNMPTIPFSKHTREGATGSSQLGIQHRKLI